MTAQQLEDFRFALGILSLLLAAGLVLIIGLISVAQKDRQALARSGKNGPLEIICTGALRRHLIFCMIGVAVLCLFAPRLFFGVPASALSRLIVLLVVVGAVIWYAATETLDRWKVRFYFKEYK